MRIIIEMNAGCKDCATREPGCHKNCERYNKFRNELEMIKKAKSLEHMFADVECRKRDKLHKCR